MNAAPHDLFLVALRRAERIRAIMRTHPEAEQLYNEMHSQPLTATLQAICSRIVTGDIDPPRLSAQIKAIEAELSRFAAPGGNWN